MLARSKGHEVAVWSPRNPPRAGEIKGSRLDFETIGTIATKVSVEVLADPSALADWEVVVIAVPATAYEDALPRLAPHLRSTQLVVCSGSLSFVPLWIAELARGNGTFPTLASWGTTLGTGRIQPDRTLKVGTIRGPFEMAVIPRQEEHRVAAKLEAAFGTRFKLVPSMLVPMLSNINPVAHAGQAIPNLSRMEKGESWWLFQNFQEVGGRIAEKVDAERLAIAEGFGLSVRSLREHYHLSYHVPKLSLPEISRAISTAGLEPLGPTTIEHRYLDEDVPFGLVVYELLGRVLDVETPATTAAITLLGLARGVDYRAANKIISELQLSDMSSEQLAIRARGDQQPSAEQISA